MQPTHKPSFIAQLVAVHRLAARPSRKPATTQEPSCPKWRSGYLGKIDKTGKLWHQGITPTFQ